MSDPFRIELPNAPEENPVSGIRYVTRSPDESRLLREIADAAAAISERHGQEQVGPMTYRLTKTGTAFRDFAERLRVMAEE